MAFAESGRGDINYLELLNDKLGKHIEFIEEQLRDEKKLNRELLQKLGIIEGIKKQIDTNELYPIGGRKPLHLRIMEKERESREELRKIEESQNG